MATRKLKEYKESSATMQVVPIAVRRHTSHMREIGRDMMKLRKDEVAELEREQAEVKAQQASVGKLLRRKIRVTDMVDGGASISMDQEWDTSSWSSEMIEGGCSAIILLFQDKDSTTPLKKQRALQMLDKLIYRHDQAKTYVSNSMESLVNKTANRLLRGGQAAGMLDLMYVMHNLRAKYLKELSHFNFVGKFFDMCLVEAKLGIILIQHTFRCFRDRRRQRPMEGSIVAGFGSEAEIRMLRLRAVNGRSQDIRGRWRTMHQLMTTEAREMCGGERGPAHLASKYVTLGLETALHLVSEGAGSKAPANREDVVYSHGVVLLAGFLSRTDGPFAELASHITSLVAKCPESLMPMLLGGVVQATLRMMKYLLQQAEETIRNTAPPGVTIRTVPVGSVVELPPMSASMVSAHGSMVPFSSDPAIAAATLARALSPPPTSTSPHRGRGAPSATQGAPARCGTASSPPPTATALRKSVAFTEAPKTVPGERIVLARGDPEQEVYNDNRHLISYFHNAFVRKKLPPAIKTYYLNSVRTLHRLATHAAGVFRAAEGLPCVKSKLLSEDAEVINYDSVRREFGSQLGSAEIIAQLGHRDALVEVISMALNTDDIEVLEACLTLLFNMSCSDCYGVVLEQVTANSGVTMHFLIEQLQHAASDTIATLALCTLMQLCTRGGGRVALLQTRSDEALHPLLQAVPREYDSRMGYNRAMLALAAHCRQFEWRPFEPEYYCATVGSYLQVRRATFVDLMKTIKVVSYEPQDASRFDSISITELILLPFQPDEVAVGMATSAHDMGAVRQLVDYLCHPGEPAYFESLPWEESAASCQILQALSQSPLVAAEMFSDSVIYFLGQCLFVAKFAFLGKSVPDNKVKTVLSAVAAAGIALSHLCRAAFYRKDYIMTMTAAVRHSNLIGAGSFFIPGLSAANSLLKDEDLKFRQEAVGFSIVLLMDEYAAMLLTLGELEEEETIAAETAAGYRGSGVTSSAGGRASSSRARSSGGKDARRTGGGKKGDKKAQLRAESMVLAANSSAVGGYMADLDPVAVQVVALVGSIRSMYGDSPHTFHLLDSFCNLLEKITAPVPCACTAVLKWKVFDALVKHLPPPLAAVGTIATVTGSGSNPLATTHKTTAAQRGLGSSQSGKPTTKSASSGFTPYTDNIQKEATRAANETDDGGLTPQQSRQQLHPPQPMGTAATGMSMGTGTRGNTWNQTAASRSTAMYERTLGALPATFFGVIANLCQSVQGVALALGNGCLRRCLEKCAIASADLVLLRIQDVVMAEEQAATAAGDWFTAVPFKSPVGLPTPVPVPGQGQGQGGRFGQGAGLGEGGGGGAARKGPVPVSAATAASPSKGEGLAIDTSTATLDAGGGGGGMFFAPKSSSTRRAAASGFGLQSPTPANTTVRITDSQRRRLGKYESSGVGTKARDDVSAALKMFARSANYNNLKLGSTNDVIMLGQFGVVPLCCSILHDQDCPRDSSIFLNALSCIHALANDSIRMHGPFTAGEVPKIILQELSRTKEVRTSRYTTAADAAAANNCLSIKYVLMCLGVIRFMAVGMSMDPVVLSYFPLYREHVMRVLRLYPQHTDFVNDTLWQMAKACMNPLAVAGGPEAMQQLEAAKPVPQSGGLEQLEEEIRCLRRNEMDLDDPRSLQPSTAVGKQMMKSGSAALLRSAIEFYPDAVGTDAGAGGGSPPRVAVSPIRTAAGDKHLQKTLPPIRSGSADSIQGLGQGKGKGSGGSPSAEPPLVFHHSVDYDGNPLYDDMESEPPPAIEPGTYAYCGVGARGGLSSPLKQQAAKQL